MNVDYQPEQVELQEIDGLDSLLDEDEHSNQSLIEKKDQNRTPVKEQKEDDNQLLDYSSNDLSIDLEQFKSNNDTCIRSNTAFKYTKLADTGNQTIDIRSINIGSPKEDVFILKNMENIVKNKSPSSRLSSASSIELVASTEELEHSTTIADSNVRISSSRQEGVSSECSKAVANLDGVQSVLDLDRRKRIESDSKESSSDSRVFENSNTELIQSKIRFQSNSIKNLEYSANNLKPDHYYSNADKKDQHDLVVSNLKLNDNDLGESELKKSKESNFKVNQIDKLKSVINLKNKNQIYKFIDKQECKNLKTTSDNSIEDNLIDKNRTKFKSQTSSEEVFGNDSFIDCSNLVVNCDLEDAQNSNSSFLVNPTNLLNSNLLLTTVDSIDLSNDLISDNLIKENNDQIELNNQTKNQNLLTTVLFVDENSQQLSSLNNNINNTNSIVNNCSTTGDTSLNFIDTAQSKIDKLDNSLDILSNNNQILNSSATTTTFLIGNNLQANLNPLNARVLVIESLSQLNELTSSSQNSNIFLTTSTNPLIGVNRLVQKTIFNKDSIEKTCQPSSVISHCSSVSTSKLTNSKNNAQLPTSSKRSLKRQFAIDENNDLPDKKLQVDNESKQSDHVLVIKELNTDAVDNCLVINSDLSEEQLNKILQINKEKKEETKTPGNSSPPIKEEEKVIEKDMLDANDFRGVLNAAVLSNLSNLNAVAVEHQNSYQSLNNLNGRLTPPSYNLNGHQLSSQSQLAAANQYATLQPLQPLSTPLPPMSTMTDKFTHHYVLNGGNHGNHHSTAAGNQSVIGATANCASQASVHPGFTLMPNTTLGKTIFASLPSERGISKRHIQIVH